MGNHPGDRELKALLAGRLGRRARRRVVRHLLSRCEACPARMRALIPPGRLWSTSVAETEEVYDACIDRAAAAARRAEGSVEKEHELRDQGIALVRAKGWGNLTPTEQRRFSGRWARVEMLLALSFEMRFRNRRLMLELALSAEQTAARLAPGPAHSQLLLFDLQARVAAEVVNAQRVNERFFLAGQAVEKARALLTQGTEDLMVEAYIDEVEASLLKDNRGLAEAEYLLDRAQRTYLKLGQRHLAGRVLVTKGVSSYLAGRAKEAVGLLREALEFLDESRDPQLVATAQHDLVLFLAEAGEIRAAGESLLEAGLRKKFAAEPLNLLRLRWVEAKLHAAHGRREDAERIFTEVRDCFRAEGLELVAAVAGLDVAKVALEQGRLVQAHELARELMARAEDRHLPAAAQSALRHFMWMCELEVATAVNALRVQRFLNRLAHMPGLKFEVELILFD